MSALKEDLAQGIYGRLRASASGFQWSGPARKILGMYWLDRAAVSWWDQGTRALGLVPGPVHWYSA
jgi:hypothetical protein